MREGVLPEVSELWFETACTGRGTGVENAREDGARALDESSERRLGSPRAASAEKGSAGGGGIDRSTGAGVGAATAAARGDGSVGGDSTALGTGVDLEAKESARIGRRENILGRIAAVAGAGIGHHLADQTAKSTSPRVETTGARLVGIQGHFD